MIVSKQESVNNSTVRRQKSILGKGRMYRKIQKCMRTQLIFGNYKFA